MHQVSVLQQTERGKKSLFTTAAVTGFFTITPIQTLKCFVIVCHSFQTLNIYILHTDSQERHLSSQTGDR